jgi:hypothetical protein
MTPFRTLVLGILVGAACATSGAGVSDEQDWRGQVDDGPISRTCTGLPSQGALKRALTFARNQASGGFNLDMWASVVNRDGVVCAVAFTGFERGDQWPGSRVISAQKGEHRQCLQPAGIGTVHRQPVLRGAVGRQPVRAAAQQSR